MYSVSSALRVVLTITILAVSWGFLFPVIGTVILAVLNDLTMLTLVRDPSRPAPKPERWNLVEIFSTAIVLGMYLTGSTVVFFAFLTPGGFFNQFPLLHHHLTYAEMRGLIYLQISLSNLSLIFVTRTRSISWMDRPGVLVMIAFVISQAAASAIGAYGLNGYPNDGYFNVEGAGWAFVGVTWLYCLLWYLGLDTIKFILNYISQISLFIKIKRPERDRTVKRGFYFQKRPLHYQKVKPEPVSLTNLPKAPELAPEETESDEVSFMGPNQMREVEEVEEQVSEAEAKPEPEAAQKSEA